MTLIVLIDFSFYIGPISAAFSSPVSTTLPGSGVGRRETLGKRLVRFALLRRGARAPFPEQRLVIESKFTSSPVLVTAELHEKHAFTS